jgi:3'-phosphoadenosine 5'-phosphosulfate sulfotransferase (PAPS reductase)/FAD synthetase
VLLHLVRSIYPDVPAVFVDTGLEYPEIRKSVKETENVEWLRPEMQFKEVLEKYGYPVVSKRTAVMIRNLQNPTENNKATRNLYLTGIRQDGKLSKTGLKIPQRWLYLKDAPFKISEKCCDVMKKKPFKKYERRTKRKAFVGMMAADSRQRTVLYLQDGCNSFTGKVQSNPLGFWLEEDIWAYLKEHNIPYSTIYDMGYQRTGCMFCMFGAHMNKPNRFQLMAETHPKQYKFCMETLGLKEVLEYIGVDYKPITTLEEFDGH